MIIADKTECLTALDFSTLDANSPKKVGAYRQENEKSAEIVCKIADLIRKIIGIVTDLIKNIRAECDRLFTWISPIPNPTIVTGQKESLAFFSCDFAPDVESLAVSEDEEAFEDVLLASQNQYTLGARTACSFCSLAWLESLLVGNELNNETLSSALRSGVRKYFNSPYVNSFVSAYEISELFPLLNISQGGEYLKIPENNLSQFFEDLLSRLFENKDYAGAVLTSSNSGHSTSIGKFGTKWYYFDSAGLSAYFGNSRAISVKSGDLEELSLFLAELFPYNTLNPITEHASTQFCLYANLLKEGYSQKDAQERLLENLKEIGVSSLPEEISLIALEAHIADAFGLQIPNMIDLTLVELA